MNLSKKDYIKILEFYNLSYTNKNYKKKAEDILAEKLCKCIKKVDTKSKDETKAIAICTNSVLSKKNLKVSRTFSCKKKAKFLKGKSQKNKLKIKK